MKGQLIWIKIGEKVEEKRLREQCEQRPQASKSNNQGAQWQQIP